MAATTRTFRDFFAKSFLSERTYERFEPHHFQKLYEMAMRHDVIKKPVNFDKDDIQFLSQFPHAFWIKAKQMRYQMLFDAIHKLHGKRREAGHEKIKAALINAIKNQDWSGVKGLMPDDKIERIARWLRPELVRRMSDKQIDIEADKLAHEHIKEGLDHLEEPGEEVPFTFKDVDIDETGKNTSSNKTGQTVTYMAKPYLNRLYHKLERTKGLPHLKGSGLEGEVGKYGYDMAEPIESGNPEELPHSTSGMKFPTPTQIRDRMRAFMNLNAHRIFGDLPEDAEWLPTGNQDVWSINYIKDEVRKQIESELRVSGKYEDNRELEADARKMARDRVIEMAKRGELKGPPIPGKFPDGIPIEFSNGKLQPPPLYLPFRPTEVKVKNPQTGAVESKRRMIPVVNPASFFRELGSDDSDYEWEIDPATERPRKKYDDQGRPIFKVQKDKLRGHQGQFVHVDDDEFVPTKHKAGGAIDFNHNTEGRYHLTRGDEGYEEAFEKVFGDQRHVLMGARNKLVPSDSGGFYEDIMRGILLCYKSQACGGSSGHERAILLQNIEDVHQIIMQTMLMDLRNPKLYDEEGRVNYAKGKATNYIQKDQGQGGGTRRLRKLTQAARTASLDATTQGKEGEVSIADKLLSQAKDKDKLRGGESEGPVRLQDRRGKGGRRLDTSGHKNAYNLDNFRSAMRQLSTLARAADSTSERAKQISQRQTGQEIIALLQAGIDDRADVIERINDLLAALYQNAGTEDPEKTASRQVQSWVEDGANTSEKLVAAFQNHPLVQDAMASSQPDEGDDGGAGPGAAGTVTPGQREAPASEEEREALDFFHKNLARMREDDNFDLSDEKIKGLLLPKPGEKFGAYVRGIIAPKFAEVDQERVMARVQDEINRLYGVTGQPEGKQAAKAIAPQVDVKAQGNRMRDILARRKAGTGATPAPTPADAPPAAEVKPEAPAAVKPALKPAGSYQEVAELTKKKDYVGLAHHPHFLDSTHPTNLAGLLRWFEANRDKVQPHEFDSSVTNLRKAMQTRGGS